MSSLWLPVTLLTASWLNKTSLLSFWVFFIFFVLFDLFIYFAFPFKWQLAVSSNLDNQHVASCIIGRNWLSKTDFNWDGVSVFFLFFFLAPSFSKHIYRHCSYWRTVYLNQYKYIFHREYKQHNYTILILIKGLINVKKDCLLKQRTHYRLENVPENEPTHDRACATSEDTDQTAHPRSLIRDFPDRVRLLQPTNYSKRDILELLSYCIDVQADVRLWWLWGSYCRFVVR